MQDAQFFFLCFVLGVITSLLITIARNTRR